MHALILLCINQHTTFEVPNFTDYKQTDRQTDRHAISASTALA